MPLNSVIPEKWLREMEELALTRAPNGCFVEVGVYKGGSAARLYTISQAMRQPLHLFDTFTGIPFQGEHDRHKPGDFSDVNVEELMAAMPAAIFHVGLFPDTLTAQVGNIAFLHVDVDQYQSQKSVNEHLWPRMVRGGIMLIDDYFLLDGIRKAVDEDFPGQLHYVDGQRPFIVKA